MITKFRLALGLLLLAPALAHALGLGDMRLASGLNQPLSADIEIVGASAEDLLQLRAGLPAREMFTRYGVDRPMFLSGFTFTVGKDASGRAVLKVRSSDPVTEPFVTFLVEVTWPRGHLIREYTALLDPPVFENKQAPAAPVAAPAAGATTSATAGAVERPATPAPAPTTPAEAPTAAAAPAAPAPATSAAPTMVAGGEYQVVRGDTLSQIAHRAGAVSRADVNRLMLATFKANPTAFDGNINRLHKGAVLKIPGSEDWGALDAGTAAHEVGRQIAEWRAQTGTASTAGEGRLRLVPPTEGPAVQAGPAPAPAPAPAEKTPSGPSAKDKAAADKAAADKRLLELRNEALAEAQREADKAKAKPSQPPSATGPAAQPPATAQPTPATAPAAPPPAAETAPKPAPAKAAPPAPAAEPGLIDTLLGNWMYLAGAALVVLLAAVFLMSTLRRRRADKDFDQAMQPAAAEAPAAARVQRAEAPRESMVVEESDDDSGEFVAPPIARAPATKQDVTATASIEDTLSSETALNLEQADPLAEADFHMAYGLYDQAADIVKLAIGREPARRDLKLKLLEVYFVWGNKDAFLDVARDLGRTRDQGAAGEWDKVVIMGRQIAADDPLFAGATTTSAPTDVDLDLEAGGGQGVDLELLGGDAPAGHAGHADESIDLDLSQALAGADATADTGESKTLDPDRLDLLLDGEHTDHGGGGGTTREMRPHVDAPTVEQPALRSADAPTVETPVLAERDNTIREKLDSALKRDKGFAPDATAELSLDDLGFEVDKLGSTSASLPALSETDHPSDAPTMVAGLDEGTRALLAAADKGRKAADLEPTRESPRPATDATQRFAEATQRIPAKAAPAPPASSSDTGTARVLGTTGLDLDLDELARALESDTVEQPRREEMKFSTDVFQTAIRKAPNGLDLDVGAPLGEHREPTVTERINADELSLPELEPVTLSEVGTKLDLARAYMDMGDPDGARSILQEVLSEGSASQKQEAQRLIETLPG